MPASALIVKPGKQLKEQSQKIPDGKNDVSCKYISRKNIKPNKRIEKNARLYQLFSKPGFPCCETKTTRKVQRKEKAAGKQKYQLVKLHVLNYKTYT